jgi:hypothetical protein
MGDKKRALPIAFALLGLAVALVLVVVRPLGPMAGRVYTVAAVASGLAKRPGAWTGRTILVRGRALEEEIWRPPRIAQTAAVPFLSPSGCLTIGYPCMSPLPGPPPPGSTLYVYMFDRLPVTPGTRTSLPPMLIVRVQGPSPEAELLRRVLALLHLAVEPQRVTWGYPATYRILVQPEHPGRCAGACDDGVLLDAVAP